MKIYKIENGKTVGEIEVTNFTKNNRNRNYCFLVKDCLFQYCGLFWINHHEDNNECNSRTKIFFSLKRY